MTKKFNISIRLIIYILTLIISASLFSATQITGELKMWHKVTLTFDGPSLSETSTPNPFTDFRLTVTFKQSIISYTVTDYYNNVIKWRLIF